MADYEVDYSEVEGRKVDCPEGCGLCCLCQPEVIAEERPFFRENYPRNLVKSRGPERYTALALKKGKGSCVFLENRRCRVYDHRTTYCRQFPYHMYVSDRVKVELDLSCRGAWTGTGNDALAEAREMVERADARISRALRESKDVYRRFYSNCEESGVMSDPAAIRASVSANLKNLTDPGYLSKVMDLSQMEPVMTLDGIQREPDPDMGGLEEAARGAAMDSMSTEDILSAPVYCDQGWNWNVFMAKGDTVDWTVLDDEGDITLKESADIRGIPLKPLEPAGADMLAYYISVLNGRDSFMGNVFSLMDETGYEDDMVNAYFGCLSTSILDLMWRASMLDHFMGTGMGADGIREAVIFYDMDRLDAPTIGGFV